MGDGYGSTILMGNGVGSAWTAGLWQRDSNGNGQWQREGNTMEEGNGGSPTAMGNGGGGAMDGSLPQQQRCAGPMIPLAPLFPLLLVGMSLRIVQRSKSRFIPPVEG
jgi:hypothetical protein